MLKCVTVNPSILSRGSLSESSEPCGNVCVHCSALWESMKASCGVHQMMGADLSLVIVGRSFTVANGFPPLKTHNTVTLAVHRQRQLLRTFIIPRFLCFL